MEDLRKRLKRETKHAMDNLESLDPLQVGYKELAESIESLMNALHTAELMACNFAEEPEPTPEPEAEAVKAEETKAEEPVAETKAEEPIAEAEVKAEEPIAEVKAGEEAPQAPITKEELRAVLKECAGIDKALLPEMFARFGAAKLSEVKESDYRALYNLAKSKLGEE